MNRTLQEQTWQMNPMHSKAISHLVRLVKNSGDKLLSGKTKLALTTTILTYVNEILAELLDEDTEKSFQVQQTNHCLQSLFDDVQCLYDFFQKSAGLKITHGQQTLQGNVNISRFRSLRIFELRKIPIHLVVGLRNVKDKLTTIICSRCLHKLKDLFELCGGDMTEMTPWQNLTVAILSYNGIEQIDESLKLLPNLEVLDISHNYIKKIGNFNNLKTLKYLNISYNQLENFTIPSNCDLPIIRCLVLRNNKLEFLNGFNQLHYLEQLDIGYNCLSDHSVLNPLKLLSFLKLIWLDGNPLGYHIHHRKLTLEKLHPAIIKNQFHLDGVLLSNSEILYMKQFEYCPDGTCAAIPVHVSLNNDLVESSCSYDSNSSSFISSEKLSSVDNVINNLVPNTNKVPKKKGIVREVEIMEHTAPPALKDSQSTESKQTDHLLQVESLREQYGPDWLVASTRLNSNINTLLSSSIDEKSNSSLPENAVINDKQSLRAYNMDQLNASNENVISEKGSGDLSECLQSISLHNETDFEHKLSDNDLGYSSSGAVDHSHAGIDENEITNASNISFFSDDDDTELDNRFFIAKKINENKTVPLLLIIKEKFLYEKDIHGHTLEKLDLRGLLSIEKLLDLQSGLKLVFDSIRKDRRQRIYTLEEKDDFEKFYKLLQPIVELKVLEEMIKSAFQCLKCGAQFSKDVVNFSIESSDVNKNITSNQRNLKEIQVCPNCNSEMLIELDELPLPKNVNLEVETVKPLKTPLKEPKMRSSSLIQNQNSAQSEKLNKRKIFDDSYASKSFPATPVQQRKTKLDSFSDIIKQQLQRGKMEQMTRKELFSTNLVNIKAASKNVLYQSKSCGHSPESLSSFEINKNTDDDISLIENEMKHDHSELNEGSLEENLSSISDGIRILLTNPSIPGIPMERSNSLIEDEINCNLPNNFMSSSGGNETSKNQLETENSEYMIPQTGTMKRSESDITILSNPSQSSISVLSTPSGDIIPLDAIAESTLETHREIHNSYSELMRSRIFPRSSSPISAPMSSDEEQCTFMSGCERSLQCSPTLNETRESNSSGSVTSSISAAFENMSDVHPVPSPISQFSQGSRLQGTSSQSTIQSVEQICSSESIYYSSDNISPSIQETHNEQFISCINNNPFEQDPSHQLEGSKSDSTINSKEHSTSNLSSKTIKYSFEDFSQIDHRIHLYLEMKVFEDGETFDSLLKTNIAVLGKKDEFSGLLIISTKNIYIYKITGKEENEPKKWMEKIDVHSLAHLISFKLHLGSQAFHLEFKSSNSRASYMFLLRDAFRCNNFFGYLTDRMKHGIFSDSVESNSLSHELNSYLQGTLDVGLLEEGINNNEREIVLYLLAFKIAEDSAATLNLEPVSLVVTPAHIIMVTENFQWYHWKSKTLSDYKNGPFKPLQQESIKDLTQLEKSTEKPTQFKMHFFNEDTAEETIWHIATETETSLSLFINAIKDPWEKLFDLDLRVIEGSYA